MANVKINQTLNTKKGSALGNELSILESCIIVAGQAIELAPVDLGGLKASIGYRTTKGDRGTPSLTKQPDKEKGWVGTPIDYGIYQEFGTRKMAPQPFLRPAVGALKRDGGKTVRKIMFDSMKKYEKASKL